MTHATNYTITTPGVGRLGSVEVFDLKSLDPVPAPRDRHQTSCVPQMYNGASDCYRWKAFIERAVVDPEVFQRAVGYTLTSSVNEEQLFVLTGGPGKSTILRVMAEILGDYSAHVTSLACRRNGTVISDSLEDRRMLIGDGISPLELSRIIFPDGIEADEDAEDRENVGQWMPLSKEFHSASFGGLENKRGRVNLDDVACALKMALGPDTLCVRPLYQESRFVKPTWKLWFAYGEPMPMTAIEERDRSVGRRIREVKLAERVADGSANFTQQLRHEYPSILWWMMEGAQKWIQSGLDGRP